MHKSAEMDGHTWRKAHAFKVEKRKRDENGYIETTKGRVKFTPLAMETFGAMSDDMRNFLITIANNLAIAWKKSASVMIHYTLKTVSAALQHGNARCLVNKRQAVKMNGKFSLTVDPG